MRFILIALFSILGNIVLAQVPFNQVNQQPLLMSSSMAGAKNSKRICLSFNNFSGNNNHLNIGLSFDKMSKSLASGIGFYSLFSKNQFNKMSSEVLSNFKTDKTYFTNQNSIVAGVCIAPKYSIKSKTNPNKNWLTFSPSIFVEGNVFTNNLIANNKLIDYNRVVYSTQNPTGIQQKDSTISNYTSNTIAEKTIKYGLGFLLNTDKLLLVYKGSFENSFINEDIILSNYNVTSQRFNFNNYNQHHSLHAIQQTVHFGYSLKKSEESPLSVTPLLGIGYKRYINLDNSIPNDTLIYGQSLISKNESEINYTHASLNIKYAKILLGCSYTDCYNTSLSAISIGYQGKKMKTVCNIAKTNNSIIGFELATNFYWN